MYVSRRARDLNRTVHAAVIAIPSVFTVTAVFILMRFIRCPYPGAPEIGPGHPDAVFLGRRFPARVRGRSVHHVLHTGRGVAHRARPVPGHVHVDAGLAAVAVGARRRRAKGHGVAAMAAR